MRPWESVPGLDDSGGALLERPDLHHAFALRLVAARR
jgi:hypothetical protein